MTTKEAIEILKIQIGSWKLLNQPPRFMKAMDLALVSLIEKNKREEGCLYCAFKKYNLTKNETKNGYYEECLFAPLALVATMKKCIF